MQRRRAVLVFLPFPVLVFLDDDLGATTANAAGLVGVEVVAALQKLLTCATMAGSWLGRRY